MKKALSILLVLALVSTAVFAQGGQESYPNKNINMTVPYGAGGTTDLTARALANAYYWNRFYEKHDIQNVHELYLSKEDALRIIDIEEYEMLQKLITNQKWKVGDR